MRTELEQIKSLGYKFNDPFDVIDIFQSKLCQYTGSPYCVVVDSCTHAIELCLRYYNDKNEMHLTCPKHTYLSVPMTLHKLGIPFDWTDEDWVGYYKLGSTSICDSAVRLTSRMYVESNDMCLSFQHKKQLKIGRGGAVLTDNKDLYEWLKLSRYDGRDQTHKKSWVNQTKFTQPGYHYNLIPEDCALGIMLLDKLPEHNPDTKENASTGYPDLSKRLSFL